MAASQSQSEWTVGVDIGGTKIEVSHVDTNGVIQQRELFPSNVKDGPAAIERDIVKAIGVLKKRVNTPPLCVGIGMAGQINATNGFVYFAPNLNWHNIPLQENLEKALNLPVVVINDVRAGTWGEWNYGAGQGCDDLVCLFVGTGIGGGIVSGGHMLIGNSNTAGEIGHMTIDIHGRLCSCGNIGCFESIAGGWAIGKRGQEAVTADLKAGAALCKLAGGNPSAVVAKHIVQAFYEGDPLAIQIMEEVTQGLIAGSISIVNAFNPSRLILGGGVINGMPELIDRIESGIKKSALKAATANLQVLAAQLKQNDANVIGAATYAMQSLNKNIRTPS